MTNRRRWEGMRMDSDSKSKAWYGAREDYPIENGQYAPTSGVNPKFQGSLLIISVDSLASIAPRKNKDAASRQGRTPTPAANQILQKDGADPQKKSALSILAQGEPVSTPTPQPLAKPSSGRTHNCGGSAMRVDLFALGLSRGKRITFTD